MLIADEPTSALDASTQIEVLELLRGISVEDGTALLFVSHDLLSVFRLCQRVALLCNGQVAECLDVEHMARAQHPQMRALLQTLPVPAELLLQHLRPHAQTATDEAMGTNVMTLTR